MNVPFERNSTMKKQVLIASLALSVLGSSCLGPNKAFNNLHDWNSKLSDNRWINEAAFLGLNIIPVYGLFYVGDVLIFNSIEWWTGDNVIE